MSEELNKLKSTIAKEANNVLVDLPYFIERNLTSKNWETYCGKDLDQFLSRIQKEIGSMDMLSLNDVIHFYCYVMYVLTDGPMDETEIRNINCFLDGNVGNIIFSRTQSKNYP